MYTFLGSSKVRAAGSGAMTVTTPPADTVGADLVLLVSGSAGVAAASFSDNKSNLFVPFGNSGNSFLYGCQGGNVGAGHAFTFNPGVANSSLIALWFKGSMPAPRDQAPLVAPFTGAPGAYTPTTDDQLVLTWIWAHASMTAAVCNGPFAGHEIVAAGNGDTWPCAVAWEIQTAKATRAPTWVFTPDVGSQCESAIVSFRAGAVAAPAARRLTTAGAFHLQGGAMDSFNVCAPVTPSDTVDLPRGAAGGVWVGGAGDVAVLMGASAAPVVFAAVPAGTWLPIAARRINATGTTATGLVAFYDV